MLPGFAQCHDRTAIAWHTAEIVAEARGAIRQSQQAIAETQELIRMLDLAIELERASLGGERAPARRG
jgi:hypothetical protein